MKKGELLFILALLLPLIPMGIAGQWWLFSVFAVFYVCFGIIEWVAVARTDKTISQHFWDWSKDNKGMAWAILGTMMFMWIMLMWHLAAKII